VFSHLFGKFPCSGFSIVLNFLCRWEDPEALTIEEQWIFQLLAPAAISEGRTKKGGLANDFN